jgi:hypothetical protein
MRTIFLFSAVLLLSGCASQERRCATCGDPPRRTSLFRRLGRPKPEASSVPDAYVLPGTVESAPMPQGARVGGRPRRTRLRYAGLVEGAQR